MALIDRDDSFSVNVAEIDRQHQKLIAMINEFHDAMKQGQGKDASGTIINNMFNYTATHFKTEEQYFDRFGYPEKANHKQEHAAFVQEVSDFKDGFAQGKLGLSLDMMNYLSDWLQNHIKRSDKKYSQFFNENGLS